MTGERLIWAVMFGTGVAMLAVALFYQHVLGEAPCVQCVHARLWVAGLIALAGLGYLTHSNLVLQPIISIVTLGFSVGLGEIAHSLLSTEKGRTIGSCSLDDGFPGWFALDEWFPAIFMPLQPCGLTPDLLFGVKMSQGLIIIAALLGFLAFVSLLRGIIKLIAHQRFARLFL